MSMKKSWLRTTLDSIGVREVFVTGSVLGFTLFALFRGAFADHAVAIKAVERLGFTQAKVIDQTSLPLGMQGCDVGDAVRFTIKAVDADGRLQVVYVCADYWLKGANFRSE
jgi:hypothetical protein